MADTEPIQKQVITRIRATALLIVFGYLFFLFVDPFLYPGYTARFIAFRLIAIIYVILLFLVRNRISKEMVFPIVYLSALIIPLPTTLETFYTDGFASPYYVGLILIDVGGRLIYPVKAKRGLIISTIIFIPYIVLGFLNGNYIPAQAIQSIFHIAISVLVSAVGGELIHKLYVKQEQTEQELKRLNEALVDLSLRDPLTNAFNRRYMQQVLDQEIGLFQRQAVPFSIMICDLDRFKSVNDSDGHQVGDSVLTRICEKIHQEIRREDMLFRFGGDEFALILPNTTRDFAANLAERIRNSIRSLDSKKVGTTKALSVSIGIAQINKEDNDQSIVQNADHALYIAKRNGRDRVEMFN